MFVYMYIYLGLIINIKSTVMMYAKKVEEKVVIIRYQITKALHFFVFTLTCFCNLKLEKQLSNYTMDDHMHELAIIF